MNGKMISLTIGAGEIGQSLHNVLQLHHTAFIRDKEDMELDRVDVLNICYPPIDDFVKVTQKYIKQYNPKVTIIHSTVPVGTTREIGKNVVHSPIHGKHPNLSTGIRTFVKYIGGADSEAVEIADAFLRMAHIKTEIVSSPEASELSKIMCTTQYGWNIVLMKEIKKICKELDVPFEEVYTNWNKYYNDGYERMGMDKFRRPVLTPMGGAIGGHCVVNNCHLLDTYITKTIIEKNEEYKK